MCGAVLRAPSSASGTATIDPSAVAVTAIWSVSPNGLANAGRTLKSGGHIPVMKSKK